jgi:SAM-dependent methyltransferase
MRPTARLPIDPLSNPLTDEAGSETGELQRMDEGLHYGRAWHRYGYCYRRPESLRVLVAGCGTGRSAAWVARLNPGATVLGVDASAEAVASARRRAGAIEGAVGARLEFRAHDLAEPWPEHWGRFDFVVDLGLLARAADPDQLLATLARALDPEGLLVVTLPSHAGRQVARALRQAIGVLAPPGAGPDERVELGRDLLFALRPDHPIRAQVARNHPDGTAPGQTERVLAGYLSDRHDWTLDEADALLARAGLSFLYAATPWRWRPDRVFAPDALPDRLRGRVDRLAADQLSRLVDALDPALLADDYQLYACPDGHTPAVPDWPTIRLDAPSSFDRLVPEFTGLADPSQFLPAVSQGRVTYRTVSGVLGELDRWSHLLLGSVDGSASCGAIERKLASQSRASDDTSTRQERWIDLADSGLILLKPHDTRSAQRPPAMGGSD